MTQSRFFLFSLTVLLLLGCDNSIKQKSSKTKQKETWVKMLVEIPAGSVEKFELNKTTNKIERDSVNGQPRTINYLGYPANYGMIKQTILPYELGGDGDPLDIIAIGPPAQRGEVIEVKVIGVLKLKDKGEQDDKLIGVVKNSALELVNSMEELNQQYPGISKIIETWFCNYKGKRKMVTEGYGNNEEANQILTKAKNAFNSK